MSDIIEKFRNALIDLEYDIKELEEATGVGDEEEIIERAYNLVETYHRIKTELGLE
ncbi:hypothetical protein [Campylobacter lanienae]|uniref:hypothetical protein n=1 Tax=Campylobacter lanienae TaxID=75658 RepID=UPI0015D94D4A|nr:hypothetical protein [Campylobacter lanienae]